METADFEKAIIGALMLDNKTYFELSSFLTGEMFIQPRFAGLWDLVGNMIEFGEHVSVNTLFNEARRNEYLKNTSATELIECIECVETSQSAVYYAKQLRDAHFKRQYEQASFKIQEIMQKKDQKSAKQILDEVTRIVFSLKESSEGAGFYLFKDAVEKLQASFTPSSSEFLTTGYTGLDRLLQGYRKGNLIVIAARPGTGKTTYVLKSAIGILDAYENKIPVSFFSLEQGELELAERATAIRSGISLTRLQRKSQGAPLEEEGDLYQEATTWLQKANFFIDTSGGISLQDLKLRAIKLHADKHIGIIFIDYLSLVRPPKEVQKLSMNYQIGEITRELKILAKQLNIPIVLLCQTRRETEQRNGKGVKLSDIKDSGNIEADADVVIFLERKDDLADEGTPFADREAGAQFWVAKHRNGPKGIVEMQFNKSTVEFVDSEENVQRVA